MNYLWAHGNISQEPRPPLTNEQLTVLFDTLSAKTPGVEHPLCRDCGRAAAKALLVQLAEAEEYLRGLQLGLQSLEVKKSTATLG